jgi:anti-anti-sigma factor
MTAGYTIESIGDVTVLRLLDPESFNFERVPETAKICETFFQNSQTSKTLINFGQIEFYNSVSLGLIASLGKKAERYGRTVSLCNLNPRSVWSIQATRLHEILDIYYDEEQALSSISSSEKSQ